MLLQAIDKESEKCSSLISIANPESVSYQCGTTWLVAVEAATAGVRRCSSYCYYKRPLVSEAGGDGDVRGVAVEGELALDTVRSKRSVALVVVVPFCCCVTWLLSSMARPL